MGCTASTLAYLKQNGVGAGVGVGGGGHGNVESPLPPVLTRALTAPGPASIGSDGGDSETASSTSSYHTVSLTSSSYGKLRMERLPTLAGILSSSSSSEDEEEKKGLKKKTAVKEEETVTIRTWELMAGLEDPRGSPSPFRGSPSLAAVITFESNCSPNVSVWRKYLQSGGGASNHSSSFSSPSPRRLSFPRRSCSLSPTGGAISFRDSSSEAAGLRSLLSPPSSTSEEDSLLSNNRNKLSRSNTSSSTKKKNGKSNPPSRFSQESLFDADLLASFEKALQAESSNMGFLELIEETEEELKRTPFLSRRLSLSLSQRKSDNSEEFDQNSPPGCVDKEEVSFLGEVQAESSNIGFLELINEAEEEMKRTPFLSRRISFSISRRKSANLEEFEQTCPPGCTDKVVLYFTSLRGVRKTFEDCCSLRTILKGLRVQVDERDIWMHHEFRRELTEVLGGRPLPVPRLFIKGRYIGGAEEVKQLHEEGYLVKLLHGLPTELSSSACDGCGNARFIPCLTCNGSCKLVSDEGKVSRCDQCNENGLIMCPICS